MFSVNPLALRRCFYQTSGHLSQKKGKYLKDMLTRAKIQFEGDIATRPQKLHGESVSVCLYFYSQVALF